MVWDQGHGVKCGPADETCGLAIG